MLIPQSYSYYIYFTCQKCKFDLLCNKIRINYENKLLNNYTYFLKFIKASQNISLMMSKYPHFFKNYSKKINFSLIHAILNKKFNLDITNHICSFLDPEIINNTLHHKERSSCSIDSFTSSLYCIPQYGIIQNSKSNPLFYCHKCITIHKLRIN